MNSQQSGLSSAAKSGSFVGAFLGVLDLCNRLYAQNLEWFEVYQCLFLPSLFFLFVFMSLHIIISCGRTFFGFKRTAEEEAEIFSFLSLSIVLLVSLTLLLHLGIYQDVLVWDPARLWLNATSLILSCLICIYLRWKHEKVIRHLSGTFQNHTGIGNLLLAMNFFCIGCLLWDLYELRRNPHINVATQLSELDHPNVILISLDTVRADHLGAYGYKKPTSPFLDSLATKSAVFDFVNATSSWTLPSHASAFTGKYSFHHQAIETHQKLTPQLETFAEILQAQGYQTAGFVGGPYCKAKYGLAQGFDLYRDRLDFFEYRHTHDILGMKNILDFFSRDFRQFLLQNDGERTAREINQDVFHWLDTKQPGSFFLFINYFDAHDPYDQGSEFQSLFSNKKINANYLNQYVRTLYFDPNRYEEKKFPRQSRDELMALYDSEIRHLDGKLNELFHKLEQLSLLHNSIVVIFSDHGEEFFEHGGVLHKQTLYQEVLRVPLLFYAPGRIAQSQSKLPASLVDILPTTLAILGLEDEYQFDGRNLFASPDTFTRFILSERYARPEYGESEQRAITDGKMKLIRVQPEKPRIPNGLYNIEENPLEHANLFHRETDQVHSLEKEIRKIQQVDLLPSTKQ